jgi:hypothetical protein
MTPYDPLWNVLALVAAAVLGALAMLGLVGKRP